MGHKPNMTMSVLVALAMTGLLIAGAQAEMMPDYTAQRHGEDIRNSQAKPAGRVPIQARPPLGVQISEPLPLTNVEKRNLLEHNSGAHVSASHLKTKASEIRNSKAAPRKNAWPDTYSQRTGYTQIAGLGYYKVNLEKVQWETARRRCAQEGAHLLILNSPLEAAAVAATSGLSDWSWVGFDDFSDTGEFMTLHGTTLEEAGYERWASGEPSEDSPCGVVDEDGLLGTGTCNMLREYICELHSPDEHAQESRNALLPVGYHAVGSLGYYRAHHDAVQWETARRRCAAEGARLLVLSSALEAVAVSRTSGLSGWFWVGFDGIDENGTYVNFDGQQLGAEGVYAAFAPGEPDASKLCGVAREDGQLGTGTCTLEKQFVCELYSPGEQPGKAPAPAAPASGYAPLGDAGSYYKVHADEAVWEAARRRCAAEGAHLLFVNSQAEADAVLGGGGVDGWLWVGFDDLDAPGEYVYLDGTRLVDSGYSTWADYEPTEDLNCGIARADGGLGTGYCMNQRGFICEWEPPRPAVPPAYPAGYARAGGVGVYKAHHDATAWETARRRCQAEGARLLVLNSQEEADAVMAASDLTGWFWMGFDDYDTSGRYVTLEGTTLEEAGYEKWSPGEPDEDVTCGVAKPNGLLGTEYCQMKRPFICELL